MAYTTIMPKPQHTGLESKDLRVLLQGYVKNGNYQMAIDLINNNKTLLESRSANPEYFNIMSGLIKSQQEYFSVGVLEYLINLINEHDKDVENLIDRGEFLDTEEYYAGNIVLYVEKEYMCVVDAPVGTLPSDTNYFVLLNITGDIGPPFVSNISYKGDWVSGFEYNSLNAVTSNNAWYICLNDGVSSNIRPENDSSNWQLMIESALLSMYVNDTEPTDIKENEIWYEII